MLPANVLEQLGPIQSLRQGRWSVDDQFEYRFATNAESTIFQCAARIRNGLVVIGFVVTELGVAGVPDDEGWVSPATLPSILSDRKFTRRVLVPAR